MKGAVILSAVAMGFVLAKLCTCNCPPKKPEKKCDCVYVKYNPKDKCR